VPELKMSLVVSGERTVCVELFDSVYKTYVSLDKVAYARKRI
jgi:hypothetical protein